MQAGALTVLIFVPLQSTTSSVAEEKTSGLLSNSKEKLETILLILATITAAAMVSGILYDLVMRTRRRRRVYSNGWFIY